MLRHIRSDLDNNYFLCGGDIPKTYLLSVRALRARPLPDHRLPGRAGGVAGAPPPGNCRPQGNDSDDDNDDDDDDDASSSRTPWRRSRRRRTGTGSSGYHSVGRETAL